MDCHTMFGLSHGNAFEGHTPRLLKERDELRDANAELKEQLAAVNRSVDEWRRQRDACLEALKKITKLQLHLTARCHTAGPNLDECTLCIAQSAIALCEKGQQW